GRGATGRGAMPRGVRWIAVALVSMGLAPELYGQSAPEERAVQPAAQPPAAPLVPAPDRVVSVTRLTDPTLLAHRPRFSPDGQSLVFYAGEGGHADIYR